MSEFQLPQEVVDQVKTLFESPGRIAAALDMLRVLDREPGQVVLRDMGAVHGIDSSTMYQIKTKLTEAGLWNNELGSIPLYTVLGRSTLKESQRPAASPRKPASPRKQTSMKKQGEKGDKLAQGGQVGGQIEQDELGEPEGEEGESRQDETGEFERRFARLERTIEDLAILSKSNQAAVTRIVKERSNLTVKKPKADPEPEAEEPEETPAKGYDDAGENYVEPEYPRGTSRDQAANPNTLRKIIIQFTPFSLMGYDYAVQNGFEGTESDFVNLTIESYFTSRGIELQWIKRTRIQAAPPQGRLTL